MAATQEQEHVAANRLLGRLPAGQSARLMSDHDIVMFELKDVVYEPNQSIRHVYFPLSGVMSMMAATSEGWQIEIATVGNEGMIGTPVSLGAPSSPQRVICQIPAQALRIGSEAFLELLRTMPALESVVRRYTQALLNQVSQSVVCNQVHSVEQRMCKWLLMTHDRVQRAGRFPLTQEFLAQMLGVRRPSVSVVARILYEKKLIVYTRGVITILDRAGLERGSCSCYEIVNREFQKAVEQGGWENGRISA